MGDTRSGIFWRNGDTRDCGLAKSVQRKRDFIGKDLMGFSDDWLLIVLFISKGICDDGQDRSVHLEANWKNERSSKA